MQRHEKSAESVSPRHKGRDLKRDALFDRRISVTPEKQKKEHSYHYLRIGSFCFSEREKILLVVWCIFLPLFLLLLSYQLTLGFSSLMPAQENVFQFLDGKGELNPDYTAAERSHLEDVAKVMRSVDIFFYASGAVLLFILLYFRKDKLRLLKLLRYGGITSIAAVGIILLGILLAFNSSFTAFHLIFFPQGNWQFAAESVLIQAFPIEFFIKISFFIFGMALAEGLLIFVVSVVMRRYMHSTT